MIDEFGAKITKEERYNNSKNTPCFRKIDQKLKEIGLTLAYGFINDGILWCGVKAVGVEKHPEREYTAPEIYIDGFAEDNKHAKIRMIPKFPTKEPWIEDRKTAEQFLRRVQEQFDVYNELCEMDFSGLYRTYEKTDPQMENGKFDFSEDNYGSSQLLPVIDYLKNRYGSNFAHAYGFKSDDRIVVITKDFNYASEHFAPAYYDLHIFKDGQEPVTKKHALSGSGYHDFFVDEISNDNGEEIGVKVRVHVNPGLHKCDDEYIGYAEINNYGGCRYHPLIFVERRSERDYGNPFAGESSICGWKSIVTQEEMTEDMAFEYSRDFYGQRLLENDEYER